MMCNIRFNMKRIINQFKQIKLGILNHLFSFGIQMKSTISRCSKKTMKLRVNLDS